MESAFKLAGDPLVTDVDLDRALDVRFVTECGELRTYSGLGGLVPRFDLVSTEALASAVPVARFVDLSDDGVRDLVYLDGGTGELVFRDGVDAVERRVAAPAGLAAQTLTGSEFGERVYVLGVSGDLFAIELDGGGDLLLRTAGNIGLPVDGLLVTDLTEDSVAEVITFSKERASVCVYSVSETARGLLSVNLLAQASVGAPTDVRDGIGSEGDGTSLYTLSNDKDRTLWELRLAAPTYDMFESSMITTGASGDRITPTDFDGDGDTDFFVGSRAAGLKYIERLTSESVAPVVVLDGGIGAVVSTDDLTSNGFPDLMVYNAGGETLMTRISALSGPFRGGVLDVGHGASFVVEGLFTMDSESTMIMRGLDTSLQGLQLEAALLDGALAVFDAPGDVSVGDSFEILTAADGLGGTRFDAAFLPGLPGDLFFRLRYIDGGGARGAGSVSIVVDTLGGMGVSVDPQDPTPLDGLPSGAALGDIAGDADGVLTPPDGLPDLVVAIPDDDDPDGVPGQVIVLLNAGDNDGDGAWDGFSGGTLIQSTQAGGEEPVSVGIGDLDNDMDLDIVVANGSSASLTPMLNEGPGGISALPPIPAGVDRPRTIVIADFDGDGRADAAVGGSDSGGSIGQLSGLLSSGTPGAFAVPNTISFGSSLVFASLGDLDNDKDLDLAVADSGRSAVHTVLNLDDGGPWAGFALDQTIAVGAGVVQASLGDLDNDKDLDLITADRIAGTASLATNAGDGTMNPAISLPIGTRPRSLALADLDQDFDLDVAIIVDDDDRFGERLVRLLRNDTSDGQLVFAAALDVSSDLSPLILLSEAATLTSGVFTRDLDGDGDDDVVAVNEDPPSARGDSQDIAVASTAAFLQGLGDVLCPADLTSDDVVDASDLAIVLASWGMPGQSDLDESGAVDATDIAIVISSWGNCQ